VIRKEAWPFYRTSYGVRLCWVSKNLKDLQCVFLSAKYPFTSRIRNNVMGLALDAGERQHGRSQGSHSHFKGRMQYSTRGS